MQFCGAEEAARLAVLYDFDAFVQGLGTKNH